MSITSSLVTMQNSTAIEQAKTNVSGENNEVTADMFLKLMLEQLKYQDPLDPVSNTEFLSQQASFSQLQELMDINNETASGNSVQQALNLVGKEVTIQDPNNSANTITGTVESAAFDENDPTITINGNKYPLSNVLKVSQGGTSSSNSSTNSNTDAINNIKDTLSNLTSNFSGLAETVGTISSKIQQYMN